MWRILRAELNYNRLNFMIFLSLLPPVLVYSVLRSSSVPLIIVWLFALLAVNNWNAFRIREKREFQLVQLPVSVRQLALARLTMLLLAPAVFMTLYGLLQAVANPGAQVNTRVLITLYASLVLVFSLAFMFRDRFLGSKLLKQGKIALVAAGVLLLAANFYALMIARRGLDPGSEPPAIVRVLGYIFENNPSTTTMRTAIFLAICLGLAFLTIVTFSRRRTYIE